MTTITFTLDLPEELKEHLGSRDQMNSRAKEALVLQLLRVAEISQGIAAEALGITRWEVLQLMARDQIYSGPESAEEATRDVEAARVDGLATASRAGG
jgi:hypothetical protein